MIISKLILINTIIKAVINCSKTAIDGVKTAIDGVNTLIDGIKTPIDCKTNCNWLNLFHVNIFKTNS